MMLCRNVRERARRYLEDFLTNKQEEKNYRKNNGKHSKTFFFNFLNKQPWTWNFTGSQNDEKTHKKMILEVNLKKVKDIFRELVS